MIYEIIFSSLGISRPHFGSLSGGRTLTANKGFNGAGSLKRTSGGSQMNTLKVFLLVSAASYFAIGEVMAADQPTKSNPVEYVKKALQEYVKVCTLYGDGYFYMPGTDTCIKIGGYLRAEVDINAGGTLTPGVGPVSANNRDYVNDRESQSYFERTRFLWTFDTRTQTDYGTLRSYARTGIQWSTGDSVNAGSNASAYIDRAFI
jgi:Porin subfamily